MMTDEGNCYIFHDSSPSYQRRNTVRSLAPITLEGQLFYFKNSETVNAFLKYYHSLSPTYTASAIYESFTSQLYNDRVYINKPSISTTGVNSNKKLLLLIN